MIFCSCARVSVCLCITNNERACATSSTMSRVWVCDFAQSLEPCGRLGGKSLLCVCMSARVCTCLPPLRVPDWLIWHTWYTAFNTFIFKWCTDTHAHVCQPNESWSTCFDYYYCCCLWWFRTQNQGSECVVVSRNVFSFRRHGATEECPAWQCHVRLIKRLSVLHY